MLKKAASGVLPILPPSGSQTCHSSRRSRSRTESTLERQKGDYACASRFGKANVAVARKLAILLHRLWVTEVPFTPVPS